MVSKPKKLVLAVIDALKPEMLERAIEHRRAPVMAKLIEDGLYVRDCVSTFPSVTPVAASAIATGAGPDEHHIPAMNWYHRGEERYVEYGSSFEASRTFGIVRSLQDLVYNLNLAHLSRARPTLFEHLADGGFRSACTTYMIYRGRTRHQAASESMYSRLARAAQFRHAVWGPDELFYADLFASRRTDCRSTLGLPGQRDQHAGCVGAHLVEHDLFDFMLASLPDNDTYSHRRGPFAQVTSIVSADRALERIMHAAGGPDAFLEEHAVIVMSDHSQVAVEGRVNLAEALAAWDVLGPDGDPTAAEIAVCPSQRSAQVYILDRSKRRRLLPRVVRDLRTVDELDALAWMARRNEAAVATPRGELRFAPGEDVTDERGAGWSVDGELEALGLAVDDGRVRSRSHPLALSRLWSALHCPQAGDVLVSAGAGIEFVDWGGIAHVGGGSHGSLSRGDSLGALIVCGVDPPPGGYPEQFTVADVTPLVLHHFSLPS